MSDAKPLRVLIADDYPPFVALFRRLLASQCDVVGAVADCASLLQEVARLRPDVVLLDLNLPGGSGLDACREITRTAGGTRVIVLTGGIDARDRPHVLDAGASAFIDKHALADELLPAIVGSAAP